jgi:hypothetical protein
MSPQSKEYPVRGLSQSPGVIEWSHSSTPGLWSGDPDPSWGHDYYSTWFPLTAIFLISEDKFRVIKLKSHYFISASHDVILL